MTGRDVQQLNANLVAVGYASRAALDPASPYFSSATKDAVKRLQAALGVHATGKLDLGRAVFLTGPARITKVMTMLGGILQPGAVVAEATTTRREVLVDLDASQQASVKAGDRVRITLPDNRTTGGVVTGVGKVATSSNGGSGSATVAVHIAPRNPRATGSLDRATVRVAITTARVRNALVVPVTGLLALAGGGYAVETVDARRVHHLVPVTLGLSDEADGLVQVTGSLSPGQQIVVPSS
jgi:peptidoglycan hydrolase-like protein with peptidoglycan-binding domain